MKMSKLGYFFEFLLLPPFVLVATLLAFRNPTPPHLMNWCIVFCRAERMDRLAVRDAPRRHEPRATALLRLAGPVLAAGVG